MIHNRKVCKNEAKNTCHRVPAGHLSERTVCTHTKGLVLGLDMPSARAEWWKDGAGGNKNQSIFTAGAGEGGARRLQGGAALMRASPACGWFRSLVPTEEQSGREGMRAGG